jgi:BON domain
MTKKGEELPDVEPTAPAAGASAHGEGFVAGFAGPGYAGFGGSAGYHGSGAGGVTGGYAGGGPADATDWRGQGDTRFDDRIADDVRACLERSEQVDSAAIQVEVEAGVVTLEGDVATRHMKHIATELVAAVPRVAEVKNHLNVEQGLLDELREKLAR